jgi:glycosyltransferase involved in cell wall biosynthesis
MVKNYPLVTVGVPTYNRSKMLIECLNSLSNQLYKNIEVIISDNNSTDNTYEICKEFVQKDNRFKYYKQAINIGPKKNFEFVLNNTKGKFFMWLGDDDYLDKNYLSTIVPKLLKDENLALASGYARYYSHGKLIFTGKILNITNSSWFLRVVIYYLGVTDNGMFYGLMPTKLIKKIKIRSTIAGDWHMLANLAAKGPVVMLRNTYVNRNLGGSSTSYLKIAKIGNLPKIEAFFPMPMAAWNSVLEILKYGYFFKKKSYFSRALLSVTIFTILLFRPLIAFPFKLTRFMYKNFIK